LLIIGNCILLGACVLAPATLVAWILSGRGPGQRLLACSAGGPRAGRLGGHDVELTLDPTHPVSRLDATCARASNDSWRDAVTATRAALDFAMIHDVELRNAAASDAPFLLEMLIEACNWSGEQRVTRSDVRDDAQLRHYVSDWPQPDDLGIVAIDRGTPVGAAWARTFAAHEPGYGFVAPDVPELSMAVITPQRGRGVGRRLLEAIVARASDRGWRALSLSVEDGNRAAELYAGVGFRCVGRNGRSTVMLLEFSA
jgi:GNAT superfamily N-acetyltransferase